MTNGQDSAFAKPTVYGEDEDRPGNVATYEDGSDGLTKREYFAAMAMAGLMNHANWHGDQELAATCAVGFADKLIEALNVGEKK